MAEVLLLGAAGGGAAAVDAQIGDGSTALYIACFNGHEPVANLVHTVRVAYRVLLPYTPLNFGFRLGELNHVLFRQHQYQMGHQLCEIDSKANMNRL